MIGVWPRSVRIGERVALPSAPLGSFHGFWPDPNQLLGDWVAGWLGRSLTTDEEPG